jgi:hypothetical protein
MFRAFSLSVVVAALLVAELASRRAEREDTAAR